LQGGHDLFFRIVLHDYSESHTAEQYLPEKMNAQLIGKQNPVGFFESLLQDNQFVCSGEIK